MGVTGSSEYFKHASREPKNRHIKGAASEVVNQERAGDRLVLIQTVGNRRRSRLIEQTQHVEARQFRSVFGRLTLRVVEIRWHRDHRTIERFAKALLRALLQ